MSVTQQTLFEGGAGRTRRARPARATLAPLLSYEGDAWPTPPTEEAFSGLAGELVASLAPCTEADPVAILVQLLVGVGSMLGLGPHYQVGASRHGTNEFVVLVGPSGAGRKGSSWDLVEAVLAQLDAGFISGRVVSGLSSGEGLIWHLRDDEDGPASDPRLLVLESELASVLKVISRETNTLSPVLRNAWDRKVLQVITKHDPARASRHHVSVIGHITSDELVRHVSATEAANGFLNRFVIICVRRSRLLPEGGLLDEQALTPLIARLRTALASGRLAQRLRLDEAARAIWWQRYPSLSAGRPGLLGAVCGRAEAHVIRLALTYALLDQESAIRPRQLRAALALWDYAARSAAFVFGDSLGDPVADEIRRAINERQDGLSRSQIRDLFARNRSKAEIDRALSMLAAAGAVTRTLCAGTGRSSEVWSAPSPSKPTPPPAPPNTPPRVRATRASQGFTPSAKKGRVAPRQ